MEQKKKFWQSFGELNNSEAFKQTAKDEFREELPFEEGEKGFCRQQHQGEIFEIPRI